MKLQYQLNAAFTTLLIVIMSLTAFLVYSLILDLLVQDEQRQLQAKGDLIVNLLNQESSLANVQRLSQLLQDQELQVFLYDQRKNQILFTTLSLDLVENWVNTNDVNGQMDDLWEGGGGKFVVSELPLSSQQPWIHLIMLTPLNDLQAVQKTFISRILIVFVIGVGIAILLSYWLTKRLVTPLTSLKQQLKKIEKRQFEDVQTIQASGEIKEVEQSVLDMANELQHYIQSQRHFFQNASHELKTPLMTIQGYAEGIRDGIFNEEESKRGLEVMVAEITRLKKIINEMILLAKLDSDEGIYHETKVDSRDIIIKTIDRALPLANERNISITYDVDQVTLRADEEKLLQAMLNITLNAIRHASAKVNIVVTHLNSNVTILIEDDGTGIEKDLMPKLFHRFVKGEGGETGLGLAISRAIVERSGGSIHVGQSELGGAKFIIILPVG
ncbi:HAMP domain-containing histidine kinase [Aquibacillus sp. 3ASR75-11]|uniref:histidine kinase n=1 Tax=Terrihalobacillus insolitus TaxID=2950438 RepID=A0A9X4AM95_9BACI|nr:HAMP domain-containing sensor histidine kinase [Terrihalobacillus insolitus]MDC3425182.1 HAMP domain-containing histidine kinase [Terrihalobacillus insolitus]